MPSKSPSFKAVYKLRCPYCLETQFPLAFWSRWPERCERCNYKIERESGYFSAVPWVFSYTPAVFTGIALWLLLHVPGERSWLNVLIVILASVSIALISLPFAKLLWLYMDHKLHPLEHGADR